MTTVVVHYAHEAPLTDEALAAWIAKLRHCFEVREIEWQRAFLSFDRKTVISIYEASDAGLVQMVHGMIGVPFAACYPMTVVV
jgi:hypothetical protein